MYLDLDRMTERGFQRGIGHTLFEVFFLTRIEWDPRTRLIL